jgi:AcrR family transcriptional regulator
LSTRKRLTAPERRELVERAATEVFAERGYLGASMSEIAKRSGVSVPVVYDHFASKLDLHRRLLERTRNELLEMWREHFFGDEPLAVRVPRAIEAWAIYVEQHPYAARMYFRGASGDPEADAVHNEIQGQARVALAVLFAQEPGAEGVAGGSDQESLEMAAEIMRSGLTGLAMWWADHPHVPRERIVETALNVVWVGLERSLAQRSAAGQTMR